MSWIVWGLDALAREALLFAAFGLLVGGLDDLLVDLIHLGRRALGRGRRTSLGALALPGAPGRLAIFVPAWDEVGVIGPMLRAALARLRHGDYRIYVGAYPNDPATAEAVRAVAAGDARVRLVLADRAGPTTKGHNLNCLWRALREADRAEGQRTKAVVLHDAEDVVHPDELRVFDALIERHAVVQLPVQPLIRGDARLVSGTYADEFAEAHGKLLVVRSALGAGLPLAGVGCAIRTETLAALAEERGGAPFDDQSLTEDYELGLRLSGMGGTGCFARVAERPGGGLIAVRAYFPDTLDAAVRQKARWITGIALAGWDRTGWGRATAWADHWMRARDRRAPLAVLVLAAAYLALVLWAAAAAAHWMAGTPLSSLDPALARIIAVNAALLLWRVAMRMAFTGRLYGRREALWAAPRLVVGNIVSLLAVRRALWTYLRMLRGGETVWDKTAHRFPALESGGG